MNHHTYQRFQREAHDDVRFSVTTRTAGHRMARHCNAQQGMELQSNAVCALEERAYRVALTRMQRNASHISAKQFAALPGMAKQRGSGLGNRLFSGPLWPERIAVDRKEMHRKAAQRTAVQSNADCPLATAGFPGRFGPKARHITAQHHVAPHREASHVSAIQSNADCPLATVGFPGRFGSPGRVSPAALSTD